MKVEILKKIKVQIGQSIIETMVAIFVLVMGITAALGLANYSFGASSNIAKQIIGTGLAREGLEAVKNMRDTNWLKGTKYTDCYNYVSGSTTGTCYKDWLTQGTLTPNQGYAIYPGVAPATATYKLDYTKSNVQSDQNFWTLTAENTNYALDRDGQLYATNPSLISSGKFYYPAASANGTSDFYRRITIASDNSKQPYNQATIGPRLVVTSDVWWKDKKCPAVATWELAKTACRVRLQMYMTNWRVY